MTAPAVATAESLVSTTDAAFAVEFGIPVAAEPVAPVVTPTPEVKPMDTAAVAAEILADPAAPEAPAVEVPAVAPVVEAPVVEPRKPITQFTVADAEGELEIPDLTISYKANGETLTESLDKVVRRAQMGSYNEALLKEKDGLKVQTGQLQTTLQQREELIASREAQIERLLTDEDFFAKAKDAFADYNDPTARLARAETALAQRDTVAADTAKNQKMIDFVGTKLVPAYEQLATQNPQVSPDEIWGRFARLTAPLQVRGEIPPAQWGAVEKLLLEDIGPWVAQLQEHRSTTARSVAAQTDTTVRKAQEDATRAKATLARAVKPVGNGSPTPPKAKAIVNVNDAIEDIIAGITPK